MSEVFFVFSDESGNYKQNPTEKFLRAHPYYIRSAYIIKATEWPILREKIIQLRSIYYLRNYEELKWNDPWRWYKEGKILENRYRELIKYFKESLKLLTELSFCKIIYTVTDNIQFGSLQEKNIKRWHIQEIMQRIQMEIQNNPGNLAVIFLDPPSTHRELKLFQEIYREIFLNDRLIENFKNLKDAINFEPSHHSIGIQIADYIAGCFRGFLLGYSESVNMFKNIVYPLIRKNAGNSLGYGIREVPKDDRIRGEIKRKLQEVGLIPIEN